MTTSDPASLIDPYLKPDQLHQLVTQTSPTEYLVSKQHKGSSEVRAMIATYVGGSDRRRSFEVRASADADVHDRMVTTATGQVYLLGHSLNGIEMGSASSVLVALPL